MITSVATIVVTTAPVLRLPLLCSAPFSGPLVGLLGRLGPPGPLLAWASWPPRPKPNSLAAKLPSSLAPLYILDPVQGSLAPQCAVVEGAGSSRVTSAASTIADELGTTV